MTSENLLDKTLQTISHLIENSEKIQFWVEKNRQKITHHLDVVVEHIGERAIVARVDLSTHDGNRSILEDLALFFEEKLKQSPEIVDRLWLIIIEAAHLLDPIVFSDLLTLKEQKGPLKLQLIFHFQSHASLEILLKKNLHHPVIINKNYHIHQFNTKKKQLDFSSTRLLLLSSILVIFLIVLARIAAYFPHNTTHLEAKDSSSAPLFNQPELDHIYPSAPDIELSDDLPSFPIEKKLFEVEEQKSTSERSHSLKSSFVMNEEELLAIGDDHYTWQFMASKKIDDLERFAKKFPQLSARAVHLQDKYILVAGVFDSPKSAAERKKNFPKEAGNPWLRPWGQIKKLSIQSIQP